jgi:hypothetical protein
MTRSAARQPISIQATPEKVGTGFSSGVAANQAPMTRSAAFQPISIQATPEKVNRFFVRRCGQSRPHRLPSSRSAFKQRQKKWEPVFRPALRPIKTP